MFSFLKPRIHEYIGKELEKTFLHVNINKRVFMNKYYSWKLGRIMQEQGCIFKLLHKVWGHNVWDLLNVFIKGLHASQRTSPEFTLKSFTHHLSGRRAWLLWPLLQHREPGHPQQLLDLILLVPLLFHALQVWINHPTLFHNIMVTCQLSETMLFQLLLPFLLNRRIFYCFMSPGQLL